MARRKVEEESSGGNAPWMNTFADLMNLLLCFFVLLFSMSTVDSNKYEQLVKSLSASLNILPGGSAVIGDGMMISSGMSQLNNLADYINETGYENTETPEDLFEMVEKEQLSLSESMKEDIEGELESKGLSGSVDVSFTSQYVLLTLNGALLFDSGKAEIKEDAIPLVDKVGSILTTYKSNVIEVEGHTDSVPISGGKYKSNKELSSFRALSVAEYLIDVKGIDAAKLKYSGRGEYVPIANNDTPEGRALNRRVEIKIYNNLSEN